MKYLKTGEGKEDEGLGRGPCVSSRSVGNEREIERGGGGGEEKEFCPFWSPEHKVTNTTATPAVISSYPVFCLRECFDPIPARVGGGLTEEEEFVNWGG